MLSPCTAARLTGDSRMRNSPMRDNLYGVNEPALAFESGYHK